MLDRDRAGSTRSGQENVCALRNAKLKMEAKAHMTWTTPVITEVCIGMEVTSYLSAEI